VLASYNANTKCVYIGKKNKLKSIIKSHMSDTILYNLSKTIFLKKKSLY
jgi:hypothetical protein